MTRLSSEAPPLPAPAYSTLSDILVDAEDDELFKEGASRVVEHLRPWWPKERHTFKIFNGGRTNKLIGVYLNPADSSSCSSSTSSDEEGSTTSSNCGDNDAAGVAADASAAQRRQQQEDIVLVKVYGHKTDLMIDREAEVRNMLIVGGGGFSVRLFACFQNGLAYKFIPGVALTHDLAQDPRVFPAIARALARLHRLTPADQMGRNNNNNNNNGGRHLLHHHLHRHYLPHHNGHQVHHLHHHGHQVHHVHHHHHRPYRHHHHLHHHLHHHHNHHHHNHHLHHHRLNHGQQLPVPEDHVRPDDEPGMWDLLRRFQAACPDGFPECSEMDAAFRASGCLDREQAGREIDRMEKRLRRLATFGGAGPKVTFCHNDLLLGNILLATDNNPADAADDDGGGGERPARVEFIDYEYADVNYREFDIATHFCSFRIFASGDGSVDFDESFYPSKEFQMRWIEEYLLEEMNGFGGDDGHDGHDDDDDDGGDLAVDGCCVDPVGPEDEVDVAVVDHDNDDDDDVAALPTAPPAVGAAKVDRRRVEELQALVDEFTPLPHLLWGIWAVAQAKHSSLDFDFLRYAALHFEAYNATVARLNDTTTATTASKAAVAVVPAAATAASGSPQQLPP